MSTLQELLEEYRQIDTKLKSLAEIKESLREQITAKLNEAASETETLEFDNEFVSVKVRRTEVVEYDEDLLQERLGEQYVSILEPDIKKIRKRLPDLQEVLTPHLPAIGSPSRDLVKQQIDSGAIPVDAFRGAFEKTSKETLYVRRTPKT